MTSDKRDINSKLRIFKHAEMTGNVSKTCRYFGISRTAALTYTRVDKMISQHFWSFPKSR